MIGFDKDFEKQCGEYLEYLYCLAEKQYNDCPDIDTLVQDTLTVFIVKISQGENVEYPKGFLSAVLKNKYKNQFGTRNDTTLQLTKAEQDKIQQQRREIIKTVEGDSISLAAQKLLEENKARIAKQKREKLSDRKMELYINLDNETSSEESSLPPIEKRVIKLNTAIPEDEDFGL